MNLFKNADLLQTQKISRKAEELDKFKAEVIIAIGRFFNNDWGDVCEEDTNLPCFFCVPNSTAPFLEQYHIKKHTISSTFFQQILDN